MILNSKKNVRGWRFEQDNTFLVDNAGFSVTELPSSNWVNHACEKLCFWLNTTTFPVLMNAHHRISKDKYLSLSLSPQAQISNYASVRHSSVRYYSADKNVTCRNCGKPGHLSKNCPTPKVRATLRSLVGAAFLLMSLPLEASGLLCHWGVGLSWRIACIRTVCSEKSALCFVEVVAFIVFIKEKIRRYKLSKKRVKYNIETFSSDLVKPVLRGKMNFKCVFNKENLWKPKPTLSKWMKADIDIVNHKADNVKNYNRDETGNYFK